MKTKQKQYYPNAQKRVNSLAKQGNPVETLTECSSKKERSRGSLRGREKGGVRGCGLSEH